MFLVPFGLTPRLPRWPWASILIALLFGVTSLVFAPDFIRHEQRVLKARESIESVKNSKWHISAKELYKRQQELNTLFVNDNDLNPLIFQKGKQNKKALFVSPWFIPHFGVMASLFFALLLFGGSLEMRLGSGVFGASFVALYFMGYLYEVNFGTGPGGIFLGGGAGLYILAAGYLALFAEKEMGFWLGSSDYKPLFSVPVWFVAILGILPFEALRLGGYSEMLPEMSSSLSYLGVFVASFVFFLMLRAISPLPRNNFAPEEIEWTHRLTRQVSGNALETVKKILRINPYFLIPVDIYYQRVIEPLGDGGIVTPDNQRFLNSYLPLLFVDHFERKNFTRISEMLRGRPEQVLLSNYLKLMIPKEWLLLADALSEKGDWIESLYIYQACIDYFSDPRMQDEVARRVEVIIHKKVSEAVERHQFRSLVIKQGEAYLKKSGKSKTGKTLKDHLEHLKKTIESEGGGDQQVA